MANVKFENIEEIMAQVDAGEVADISISWGGDGVRLRSSKELYKVVVEKDGVDHDVYVVNHLIDDTDIDFTREGILQALRGERDLYDGDFEA